MNKHKICLALAFLAAASLLAQAQDNTVVSVSAASFTADAPLAANAIAAAFGVRLATQTLAATGDADPNTPGIQLPTTLGGTTVEVGGVRAGLFFVSPGQVNYLLPENLAPGLRNVVVRAADGAVSSGTVRLATVAPGLFTASGNGLGVPAGVVLRNNNPVGEPLAQFNAVLNSFTPRPIDLGGANDQVFLVLFGTGLRQRARLTDVSVFCGGAQLSVAYAGAQGGFAGLDQINVLLPRTLLSLAGRGQVDLLLSISDGAGTVASQTTQIEIAAPTVNTQVRVTGYNSSSLLAGQTLVINGAGFAPNKNDNKVFLTGADGQATAQVLDANPTQLIVLVPFGSSSGALRVTTPTSQAEAAAPLTIRPSFSGFIQDNALRPVSGMLVRVRGAEPIVARTDENGFFFLPDVTGVSAEIELNALGETPPLPYPTRVFKERVKPNGDRHLGYIGVQRNSNAALASTPDGAFSETQVSAYAANDESQAQDSVTLEVPPGTVVRFPPGTSGPLVLTVLDPGRTPSKLPTAHFSSTIAQITPFGATISPGAKLTFPNADRFPAGALVRLFRFDQTPNSATLGQFIDAGPARVSADGQRIETAADAVKETSYFFVSLERPTTTVIGQVVESDDTPVRNALVVVRGQEIFTDGNGIYILRNTPTSGPTGPLVVENYFLRPTKRVERVRYFFLQPLIDGTTSTLGSTPLPPPPANRPPLIQVQDTFTMSPGSVATISFTVTDPDQNQSVRVEATGASFLTLGRGGTDLYLLRLTPAANQGGVYTLVITAIDSLGAVATRQIALTVR